MKHCFFNRVIFALALGGSFAAISASGATILIDNLLANPSFEIGGGLGVCPTGWTCGGSPSPGFNSYDPTNVEYVAGSDGLPGSENAPDGNKVASGPTPQGGSGNLSQTGLGTYVAGNTYVLNLWIGTPLVVPAFPGIPGGTVGVIKLDFLGNSAVAIATLNATPSATPGQWTLQQFSFTPTGSFVGQTIGVELEVDSQPQSGGSNNNRIADFDIAPSGSPTQFSAVPESGTFELLGLGLVGLGVFRMRANDSSAE